MTRTVSVALKLLIGDYIPQAEKASRSTDKIGESATKSAAQYKRGAQQIVLGAGVAATAGALALGKIAGASMNFEKAMSGVAAVSNASADEMRALSDAALKAGADTAFSASEAANAEAELAKAGVSTADILGGGLSGSLNLAAAGQISVADSATIAASAMNIFGLKGSDVASIADTLAAGANKSAADVDQLGQAMSQGGQVAASMGLDLQDTVGALSMFADAGLKGSDAGTSLKTALQRLAAPSGEAADLMEKLGLRAFDAQGNFVGLEGFAGQLQSRLGGLTQEQRASALATIFGSDAVRAANVLYSQGAGGVAEYTKAVTDQGAAGRMAATQLDNLAGDVEALSGSIETALIKSGSGANSMLRGMAQGATGAVNAFADLPGPVQSAAVGMLAVGTAGAGLIAVLGTVVPRIVEGRAALREMGRAGEIADKSLGKVGKGLAIGTGVLAGLTTAGLLLRNLQDAALDAAPGIEEIKSQLIGITDASSIGSKLPTLGADLEHLGASVRRLADPSLGDQTAKLFTNISTFGQVDPKALREATQDLGAIDAALASLVSSGNAGQAEQAFRVLVDAAAKGGASVEQLKEALPGYRDALAGAANSATLAADGTTKVGDAAAGAGSKVGGAAAPTKDFTESQIAAAAAAGDLTTEMYSESDAGKILAGALGLISGNAITVQTSQIAFRDALAGLTGAVKDNGSALFEGAKKSADYNQKARDNRSAVLGAMEAAIRNAEAVTAQAEAEGKGAQAVKIGTDAYNTSVGAIRAAAIAAGFNKQQVDALIASVYKVPRSAGTKVTAPGAVRSKEELDAHNRAARKVPPKAATTVSAPGAPDAAGKMNRVTQAANNIPERISTTVTVGIRGVDITSTAANRGIRFGGTGRLAAAYGGLIPGYSPSDRADDVDIRATAGEYMIQRPTVRKIEQRVPGFFDALNAGQVEIGGDQGTIIVAVGRKVRQTPKFADGGLIRQVQGWMRAQAGEPYVYGGHGPNVWDCSGYAGGAYGLLTGRSPNQRYFTTASIGAAQGFRPGRGTFTIGVTAGEGHMAFNLAGLRGEATPPRVRVGAAAAPVTSFARQFYLPSAGNVFGGMPGLSNRQIHQVVGMYRSQIVAAIARRLGVRMAQHGGPVRAGELLRVGEVGEELFVPPSDGWIVPHSQLTNRTARPAGAVAGAGGKVVHVHLGPVNVSAKPDDSPRRVGRQIAAEVSRVLGRDADLLQRGG